MIWEHLTRQDSASHWFLLLDYIIYLWKAVGSVKLSVEAKSATNQQIREQTSEVDFLVHQDSDVAYEKEHYWLRDSEGGL